MVFRKFTFTDVIRYYSRSEIAKEIAEYARGRWIALEGESKESKRVFHRYWWREGPPLTINSEFMVRSILAKLSSRSDLEDPSNIIYATPVWDIDGSLSDIESTLKAAKVIIESLESFGISKSIYLKWSGRGLHVHIHEKAISDDVRREIHPLDIAYSIVDYILSINASKLKEIAENAKVGERPFKIENKIDIQRVFTIPLSLHRELDLAAICFKPDELDDFDISWANPDKPRHNIKWREYIEGEADELAIKAYKEVGGYFIRFGGFRRKAKSISVKKALRIPVVRGKIGRFQVMALLQAARYYLLKGDLDKAKSFGLNRAIFYAWAKYHKPRYGVSKRTFMKQLLGMDNKKQPHEVIGGELAFLSPNGWFMIGDQEQRPEDYDKQVAEKINSIIDYETAWRAALEYLKRFPKITIEDQRKFYEKVYVPVRDSFEKVIQDYLATKKYLEEED